METPRNDAMPASSSSVRSLRPDSLRLSVEDGIPVPEESSAAVLRWRPSSARTSPTSRSLQRGSIRRMLRQKEDSPPVVVESVFLGWEARRVATGAQRPLSPFARHAADYLRELQARRSMTVADLAKASGVPYEALRRYLRGQRQIHLDDINAVARALEVEPSSVLREAERRELVERVEGQRIGRQRTSGE